MDDNQVTALLTDEEIREKSYHEAPHQTLGFKAGARFARDHYEAAMQREREWRETLEAFAKLGIWALETHRENMGDLDGGDIQEKSLELGILHEVDVTEPCCDECQCAEYDDFPQKCIRMTDAALAAAKEME